MSNNNVIRKKPVEKNNILYSSLFSFILPFSIFVIGLYIINRFIFCKENNITQPAYFDFILYYFRFIIYVGTDKYKYNFDNTLRATFFLTSFCILIYALYYYFIVSKIKNEDLLGDAHWGTVKDLKKYGLLDNEGVIFGQTNDAVIKTFYDEKGVQYIPKKQGKHILSYNALNNSMVIAPTRSGKGISVVTPTCLSFNGSLVVFDPKAELWNLTSNHRSTFSYVVRFSPLSENSVHINLLDMIRNDNGFLFKDANQIADILLAKPDGQQGSNGNEEHFRESAKDLLTGVILHVKFSNSIPDSERNMSKVLSYLSNNDDEDMGAGFLKNMINDKHYNEYAHKLIVESAGRMLIKPDNERGSVFSTALRSIFLFNDYWISKNTADTDFNLDYFIDSDKPISLYLTIPVSDLDRISPIIRLLFTYLLRRFSESETSINDIKIKHRILFLIDEFPLLGRFDFIEKQLGILNGYNIIFLLVAQSISYIKKIYGDKISFFDNCKYWVTYATGDYDTAKYISEMIGKETVYKENASFSQDKKSFGTPNASIQGQDIERALITPNQIMQLPPDYLLFFGQGLRPYLGKKIIYYKMERFNKLVSNTKFSTRDDIINNIKPLCNRYMYEKNINVINNLDFHYIDAFSEPIYTFE